MSRIASIFGLEGLPADDPAPLYLRLQERIRSAIQRGDLRPLDALPGERDIAEAFSVSRVTVRKALAGLVETGLLKQRQGSGTFVAAPPQRVEQPLSRLTSFTEDMHSRGFVSTSRWLKREVSLASPQEAMRLSLSPTETVCRLSRLRLADDTPMAIERATISTRYLPDPNLVGQSLYAVLEERGVRPVRALQRLSAANLGPEEATLLDVPPGSAALSIDRLAFLETGTPIEFTHSWYRGDAYDFVAELTLRRE
ncbi:GntR family transcriptional regulator [Labrys miyagiensis]|uniref:GntR family transcriptional regulator n=1 Tax=Labrys miyagiensis TaxID=346912 RepID=A0ABQ6CL84_9HYPH|nr:GntR family transcriptional regulator [Labrys miyagiensis]GLS20930.1 GntR family transcriptional regulator [Labrys miyagiensis]